MAYPFDDRPGATVGKLQIALANEDMAETRVADCAARFERDRSRAALPKFIADVATPLARRRAPGSPPPPLVRERFDPDRVERHDHEAAYENLVNADH